MEDFYKILDCTMEATDNEIKQLVNRARLRFHPDKNAGILEKEFMLIEKAWSVLRCPEKRKTYDALLRQNKLMSMSAGLPVQNDIPFDEFHSEPIHDTDINFESNDQKCSIYWFPCRCGGNYILEEVAVLCRAPYAECTDCSLLVRVLYRESQH